MCVCKHASLCVSVWKDLVLACVGARACTHPSTGVGIPDSTEENLGMRCLGQCMCAPAENEAWASGIHLWLPDQLSLG